MVKSCCVKSCRSDSYANCEISFHLFPRDPQLRAKWMEVVGKVTCKNPVICSRHFKTDDYKYVSPHMPSYAVSNRLKEDAVPFIESETPSAVPQDSDDSMISDISEISKISEEIEQDEKPFDTFVLARPPSKPFDTFVLARPPSTKKFSHVSVNVQLPSLKEQKLKQEIKGLRLKLKRRDMTVKRLKKMLGDIRAKINASCLINNTQESNQTTKNTNTAFKPQITVIHKVVGGEK